MSFERVCARSEVPEDGALRVELPDVDVAIVDFDGQLYAIEDVCSHAEVALSDGEVEEFDGAPTIECALHGSVFDLDTGEPDALPAVKPIPVYATKVADGKIYVDVDQQLNDAPTPRHH